MSIVPEVLAHNRKFVEEEGYKDYLTDKFPEKKVVVLTCMDTRLSELLPKAMGFKHGDAKYIKNAGAVLTQPFGSAMRSILLAVYDLGAREIFVVGHHGCGMTEVDPSSMAQKFIDSGIDPLAIETLEKAGIRMEKFFRGFDRAEDGVMHSVRMIRRHPLFPESVPVHGFVMDPVTGELEMIVQDYRE